MRATWFILIGLIFVPVSRAADSAGIEFFEKKVRPLLVENCYECHSASARKVKGKLLLDSSAALMRGGESGAVVTPGKPDESTLIRAVRYADPELQMPPDETLAAKDVATLVEWVRQGAPMPEGQDVAVATKPRSDKGKNWWSFQPVREYAPPKVNDATWPRGDIDRFILAKLESAAMLPAPRADKRTLIRRVTFNLTGLPPTPTEIDAFLADSSDNAFAKVVERLLASPHYGERWGRHWLDIVRYADTSGCNGDFPMPEAWRYRNYVIDSFNGDKPYNQFLREQIAGDLLPADTDEQRFEQIIATGYLAISRRFSSVAEEFHLTLDDTVDNLSKAVLGLTIGCARCHDHKFDPIPQEDYYALYGIFESTQYAFPGTEIYRQPQNLAPLVSQVRYDEELRPLIDKMTEQDEEMYRIYSRVEKLDTGKEKNETKARFDRLLAQRDELLKKLPDYPKAYAAAEGSPHNSRLHLKGDHTKLGAEVPRGFPQILGGQTLPPNSKSSGRLELAGWLTDPASPLTARVFVNRIWQHHFARGLVRTPDDFGTRGALPTHPELLDHLTKSFINGGWSVKALHRQIVLSQTYQMACIEDAQSALRDPQNELLWTFNRRRLSAEEVRDSILSISGALDRAPGEAHPFKPEWEWRYTQHNPFVNEFPTSRRSVYLLQTRIRANPFLGTFDGADANAVTGLRRTDTPPQQALFMLNSDFAHKQAALLADRLFKESANPSKRIDRAYQLALGRAATTDEIDEAQSYLERVRGPLKQAKASNDRAAWASYFRILLSTNEFMFVE